MAQTDLRELYRRVWQNADYAKFSPGVQVLPLFRQVVWLRHQSKPGAKDGSIRILDIGCGSGAAMNEILEWEEKLELTGMDFVDARKGASQGHWFVNHDITLPWPNHRPYHWGFCTDVLEHIEEEKVDTVLANMGQHCDQVFLSICFTPDHYGATVGHPLHLTVKPFEWWQAKLLPYFELTSCRDLIGMGVFHGWSRERQANAQVQLEKQG